MPSSRPEKIPIVIRLAEKLRPTSILDVGIGFGKYGFLFREYLENWGRVSGQKARNPLTKDRDLYLVGVEANDKVITDVHRMIYDQIIVCDALQIPKFMFPFDLCLLSDIVEHLDKKDGKILMQNCMGISKHIIVTTPNGYLEQGESFESKYEVHRSGWNKSDLESLGLKTYFHNADFIVSYV